MPKHSSKIALTGKYKALTNSYPSMIVVEGISYPTLEHAFQAAKLTDTETKVLISKAKLPDVSSIVGEGFTRPNWKEIQWATMYQLMKLKFESNPTLASLLQDTGDRPLAYPQDHRRRRDKLGTILMKVRGELRA
tara:strand:+ start:540 stop:944 length:405 start_codon:yes stop_codon:yes gene_type:complete